MASVVLRWEDRPGVRRNGVGTGDRCAGGVSGYGLCSCYGGSQGLGEKFGVAGEEFAAKFWGGLFRFQGEDFFSAAVREIGWGSYTGSCP